MLAGVNDRYEQAVALAELLAPTRHVSTPVRSGASPQRGRSAGAREPRMFKVNLIPYNPTDSVYGGSGREAIAAFRDALEQRGVEATVRLTRGRDIDAACGQLAASGV